MGIDFQYKYVVKKNKNRKPRKTWRKGKEIVEDQKLFKNVLNPMCISNIFSLLILYNLNPLTPTFKG